MPFSRSVLRISPVAEPPVPIGQAARGPAPHIRLRHISIRTFRNIARLELDLPADGIAVVGENGHGKTNLLEAIYYLQLLRSVRGARDLDVVRFGDDGFHVQATLTAGAAREISVGFERSGKRKRARIDGAEPARLSEAIGFLPAILISPRDVGLMTGAPSERRRFLDITLALTSRTYLAALQAYRGALLRRNAALRDVSRTGRTDARAAVWEPPLAEHGAVIWDARRRWVAERAPRFAELCRAIGERGAATLRYVTSLPQGQAALNETLRDALASKRALDVKRGMTMTGPHRDDLVVTLAAADGIPRELRTFGSAGQHRTTAIALRMLEGETLRDHAGASPISLLDDPFAELDAQRAARILEMFAASGLGQAVLAVPRDADIPSRLNALPRWRVTDGTFGPIGAR
ncbi:MAG: DNA replication/repair protein RecF [Gemmatimonadaceae bacterium]